VKPLLLYAVSSVTLLISFQAFCQNVEAKDCTTTKEYITSLEFLRAHQELALPEKDARNLAMRASQGCSGAAQRFIEVASVLHHAGFSGKKAIQTGLKFTQRTDTEAKTFVSVFLKCFLSEFLDLQPSIALRIATDLSVKFAGDIENVQHDFEKLVKFCLDTQDLDLPRLECASLSARLAQRGEKFNGGIADSWIHLFHFLRSDHGPGLTSAQAIPLAEKLLEGGRESAENFIQAYKYAVSSNGLAMEVREAIRFAKTMTLASIQTKSEKKLKNQESTASSTDPEEE
jgi:hypothetical protein